MITVEEIRRRSENIYPEVLKASLTGETFFPKTIRADKTLSKDFTTMSKEVAQIMADSKDRKGFGYSVKSAPIKTRDHRIQDIPTGIAFETLTDYLQFIGKAQEFDQFQTNFKIIEKKLPQLKEWLIKNPLSVISNKDNWEDLLKVCEWFLCYFEADKFYIRELPISVHTKFIEENVGILRLLLDELIPDKLIASEKEFEKRFRLRNSQPLVRFRTLDETLSILNGIDDISLSLDSLSKLKLNCKIVIVVENLMNFLTVPSTKDAIGIWGRGFGIENLKYIKQLESKVIFYWSDLDTHGMQMLSQMRSYFPQTQSILMDFETLNAFRNYWVKGKPTNVMKLPHLNEDESKLFDHLSLNSIRLEQERIPQNYINKVIQTIIG